MYLSNFKLWNFRKYGSQTPFSLDTPQLNLDFNVGLNVLIGENDSGKTAIIDAIKLVLKTHAYEWIKVEKEDFCIGTSKLRIELLFKGIKPNEAKNFVEWLGWEGSGDSATPILRLILQVDKDEDRIYPSDVKAGMDEIGYPLNAEAKEYLRTTYLKPLRDAENELIAKKNSRFSQILLQHDLFKTKGRKEEHQLVSDFNVFNVAVENWFKSGIGKAEITDKIAGFLRNFISDQTDSKITPGKAEIKNILEKLSLEIIEGNNHGLGTLNRLFMAAELLHLKRDNWNGLSLCLIEELEAHLHPQAQMKVIEALNSIKNVQFILTTHSPNLASKVELHNLILCHKNDVYPLGETTTDGNSKKDDRYTKLAIDDYKFLRRFLDVTKSNLFFAKGVIIVEGWSEELLIPIIADKIGCSLTKNEVSVVNVGSTAYLRYAKIFQRNDGKELEIPVAVVTDLDVRPDESGIFNKEDEDKKIIEINKVKEQSVCTYMAKHWTLEWCLYKSTLSSEFQKIVKDVHSSTEELKNEFEKTLKEKLDGTRSKLKKVEIASRLAERISESDIVIDEEDEWLKYIVDAIKYACGKTKCNE